MATKEEIDEILDKTDIVGLVSRYVKLEKAGKDFKGLCPFHSEATPSFVVSPEKRIFKCFGCGEAGNAIAFYSKCENITYGEAIIKLAKEANVIIKGYKEVKPKNDYTLFYNIMKNSMEFYADNLLKTEQGINAIKYLNKRGLDANTIRAFNIGLAPNTYDSLYQVLHDLNYKELDMIDLGLVNRSNSNTYYDIFKDRIMFPIINDSGNVIGFSGRIYNTVDKTQPKYINTKETIIYKKGSNLFNLNLAKAEILKKKRIILHEGQMDVIASYRSGLKEAVCTLGTALTDEQAKLLKRYANHIIVCYDGDSAGIHASIKAIKLLRHHGFNIHLVKLPNGMDPDEFVLKNGIEAYSKYFEENIIDPTAYIFNETLNGKNLNDINEIENIKKIIFEELSLSSNSVREIYLKNLAKRINVSYDNIIMDFNSYYNTTPKNENVEFYDEPINNSNFIDVVHENRKYPYEIKLINAAVASKKLALDIDSRINESLDALSIQTRTIWMKLIDEFYSSNDKISQNEFLRILTVEELEYYNEGNRLLSKYYKNCKNNYSKEDIDDCINKIITKHYNNQLVNNSKKKIVNDDDLISILTDNIANKKKINNLKKRKGDN